MAHARLDAAAQREQPVPLDGGGPRRLRALIEGASASYRRRALERRRAAVAAALQRIVREARHPARRTPSSAVPIARREVLLAEPYLLQLIVRLRDGRPIDPGAVARVRAMLTDGCSPFYTSERHGALRAWAEEVRADLDDGLA